MPNRCEPMTKLPDDPLSSNGQDLPSPFKDRYLTIPNVICFARIIGSLALILVSAAGHVNVFVIGYVVFSLSDWVDGWLARWLNQRSDFGARLDSASDAVLNACLLIGSLILKWDVLQGELAWLLMAITSYAVSMSYGLWKYGRFPSYHTYGAKMTNYLVLGGAVAMLLDWAIWPLRIAAVAGTMANLEAIAITFVLPTWRADMLTLLRVLPGRSGKAD
ncbi:MAG: CDP-alcohol phosphatidyltransferase family protein [Fuerstiella sp.]